MIKLDQSTIKMFKYSHKRMVNYKENKDIIFWKSWNKSYLFVYMYYLSVVL